MTELPTTNWQADVDLLKTDDEKRMAYGWLSVAVSKDGTQIEDSQGDIIEPDELENAAHKFMTHYRVGGEMHKREVGTVVESMVFTPDKTEALGIAKGTLPTGWFVGMHIPDDDAWSKVKDGTYKAFSIGGTARREEVK